MRVRVRRDRGRGDDGLHPRRWKDDLQVRSSGIGLDVDPGVAVEREDLRVCA